MQSPTRREALLAGAILLVLINLVFAPFLWGDRTMMSSAVDAASIFPKGALPAPPPQFAVSGRTLDAGAAAWQTEPEFFLEHHLLAHGELPLWNPYVGFGEPLAANMIAQPFFPPAWIVEANPEPRGYNWFIAVRLWLGGFFAFLFMRYFVRFNASLVGAIAFAFTGYATIYYNVPNISVDMLVPALLWAVERLIRYRGWSAVGVLALVAAAVVLGGMPESAFLAFAFSILYGIVRVVGDPDLRGRFRHIAVRAAAAFALGAAVSAIAWVPFLEFLTFSFNQHAGVGAQGNIVGLAGDPWDPRTLAQYVAPLIYGPPWSNQFTIHSWLRGFWGTATAFFALVAFCSRAYERLSRSAAARSPELFFAAVTVVLLFKRFAAPGVNAIGALPGFNLVVFPRYEEIEIALCVAALAAFGVDRILSGRVPVRALVAAGFLMLAMLTAAGNGAQSVARMSATQASYAQNALLWSLLAFACAAGAAWLARNTRWTNWAGPAAAAIVTIDILGCFLGPVWYVINQPPPQAANPANGAPFVAYVQQRTAETHERFFGLDGLLYPEWSSAFGILDVRDLDALYVREYLLFVRTFLAQTPATRAVLLDRFTGETIGRLDDPLSRRFLSLSSVRYIATNHPVDGSSGGVRGGPTGSSFTQVFATPDATLVRYDDPLPRITVYTRVVGAANDDAALAQLAAPQHDVWQLGVVTESDAAAQAVVSDLSAGARTRAEAGRLERYDSRVVVASVDARARALAVLNDTDYPGWRATVDGQPAPIVRANGMFRGVEVAAGRHSIEFRYEPASFPAGLALTAVGLPLAVVLVLLPYRRRIAGVYGAQRARGDA